MWKSAIETLLLVAGMQFAGGLLLNRFSGDPPGWLRGFWGLTLGILLSYCLWILFPVIEVHRDILLALGVGGLLDLWWGFTSRRKATAGILVAALILPLLLKTPLSGWDANSIWFFHAKMIHYSAGFPFYESLSRPEAGFSHPAYPKLFAYLAALASSTGTWNDYTPKLGFVFLLSPLLVLLLNFPVALRHKLGLFLLSFLGMKSTPFLAIPEHALALWCATGTVLLFHSPRAVPAGWLALGLAGALKGEGVLYAGSAFLFLVLPGGYRPGRLSLPEKRKTFGLAAFAFLPSALWLLSSQLRISAPLGEGFLHSWGVRVSERLGQPTMDILRSFFQADRFFWEFLAVCVLIPRLRVRALGVPLGYFFALFLVYLVTPYPLAWHLITSIDRTLLPGVASCFFLLYSKKFMEPRSGDEMEAKNGN